MRVTQEVQEATEKRILEVARALFRTEDFDGVTTRDLATKAGIAAGTLFNYFPSKEALALRLVGDALQAARSAFLRSPGRGASLEEDLFSLIAAELKSLRPFRRVIPSVLETALTPLARGERTPGGEALRIGHLESVERILMERGRSGPATVAGTHLYWTLYVGVLAFWAADDSPKQEETLAVLDQAVRMFLSTLPSGERI